MNEVDLPNYKIRKHSRTPEKMRSVLLRPGKEYLEKRLEMLRTAPVTRVSTPAQVQKRSNTMDKRASLRESKERVGLDNVPMMKIKDFRMPIDLLVMAQFRKGILKELDKHHVDLTVEKLSEIKNASVKKELLDVENFKEKKQRKKLNRELISRSPLDNAIYMIRAMSGEKRNRIACELFQAIPAGTRFHHFD